MSERVTKPLTDYLREKAATDSQHAQNLLEEAQALTGNPFEASKKAREAVNVLSYVSGIDGTIAFLNERLEGVVNFLAESGYELPPDIGVDFTISMDRDEHPAVPERRSKELSGDKTENVEGKKVYSLVTKSFEVKPPKGYFHEYSKEEEAEALEILVKVSKILPPNTSLASINLPTDSHWNWEQRTRAITLQDYTHRVISDLGYVVDPVRLALANFGEIKFVEETIEIEEGMGKGQVIPKDEYLTPIEDLAFSSRVYNVLRMNDILFQGTILSLSREDLLSFRNLGKKSADEVISRMEELGYIEDDESIKSGKKVETEEEKEEKQKKWQIEKQELRELLEETKTALQVGDSITVTGWEDLFKQNRYLSELGPPHEEYITAIIDFMEDSIKEYGKMEDPYYTGRNAYLPVRVGKRHMANPRDIRLLIGYFGLDGELTDKKDLADCEGLKFVDKPLFNAQLKLAWEFKYKGYLK